MLPRARRVAVWAGLLVLVGTATSVAPFFLAPEPVDRTGPRISFSVRDGTARDVAREISRKSGTFVVAMPDADQPVTLEVDDWPLDEAIHAAALFGDCELVSLGEGSWLLEPTGRVTFRFLDANAETMALLALAYVSKNVVALGPISDVAVNAAPQQRPWDEVVARLARAASFHARRVNDIVVISSATIPCGTPELQSHDESWRVPAIPELDGRTLTLAIAPRPLDVVLAQVATELGIRIEVALDRSRTPPLSLDVERAPARAVLVYLARVGGLRFEAVTGGLASRCRPEQTIQVSNASDETWLRVLAQQTDDHLELETPLSGDVTAELYGVPAADVIDLYARARRYGIERDGKTVRITSSHEKPR